MKKILTSFVVMTVMSLSAMAVTVSDVAGTYKGNLNIGGDWYNDREIQILPGVTENTITFVLPNFQYGAASLGNIVLVNIPMDENGQLTLEKATLYLPAISERATIDVVNGLEDEGETYNSVVTAEQAMVLLSIAAPSLPEPIFVLFSGARVTDKNYAITNGGFEGDWTDNEPEGWHSFKSCTGGFSKLINGNTQQFTQSTDVRPGSAGTHSAMIASNLTAGVKANGNCTNGQINAGSMTADDADGNYNFSDPENNGYNTAFAGNPDSLVFWVKYIPANKKPEDEVNKARAHAVITTDARYQDPEALDYSAVKIAEATINYSATADMDWQRLAVPFEYTALDPATAAYMLITFTTNMTPGGGSSYSTGVFKKTYYYDNIYIDDVEMVYNHSLASLTIDGEEVVFENGSANLTLVYSDSDYELEATTDGKASQSFIGFDKANNRVLVYVIGNDYSRSQQYNVYTVQMAAKETTGIDEQPAVRSAHKRVMNGQVLIIREDGSVYNILGVKLR